MTTITIVTDDGNVQTFHHVTRIWNTDVHDSFMNGMDLLSHGTIQIDYDGGRQAFIEAASVSSITTDIR